jgi:hypothetical protein
MALQPPPVPIGPKISDNSSGRTSKARTYPDLLQSEYDCDLFEHLTTSSLILTNVETGKYKKIGPPRMYVSIDASPDGQFLCVAWVERPFSYELPVGRFPRVWQVWDRCAAAGACGRHAYAARSPSQDHIVCCDRLFSPCATQHL